MSITSLFKLWPLGRPQANPFDTVLYVQVSRTLSTEDIIAAIKWVVYSGFKHRQLAIVFFNNEILTGFCPERRRVGTAFRKVNDLWYSEQASKPIDFSCVTQHIQQRKPRVAIVITSQGNDCRNALRNDNQCEFGTSLPHANVVKFEIQT